MYFTLSLAQRYFCFRISLRFFSTQGVQKRKNVYYWENIENIKYFLGEIQKKFNLNSPEDWNSITNHKIQENGGRTLLKKYTLYELKCIACPEGKKYFNNPPQPPGYWDNKENILQFLSELKEKYNVKTLEDWNLITKKHIQSISGGNTLLNKYTIFDLKCMACPEGKSVFKKPIRAKGYWENKENIDLFLKELKETYNLNTPDDWNLISYKNIISLGGSRLLHKYSLYEIKCMACPEGNLIFDKNSKPSGYWNDKNNIHNFLINLKEKYNLNTWKDWNLITQKQIQENGGRSLLKKYSLYEIKCLGFPDGKLFYDKPIQYNPIGFWDDKENLNEFLNKLKEKFHLHTPEDWNLITHKQILSLSGSTLLKKYSLYEIKCFGCPEGKFLFEKPIKSKPVGYWDNKENINEFLHQLKEKYNLNSPEEWNLITRKQIISMGGGTLLKKYSIFDIKCFAYPNEELLFKKVIQNKGFWENKENIYEFLNQLKEKFHLHTPDDWNLITTNHIKELNGTSLLKKYSMYELKCMGCPDGNFEKSIQYKPSGFWAIENNRIQFLDELKLIYNLQTIEDWDSITTKHIQLHGGGALLHSFSIYDIKCMACPEGKSIFRQHSHFKPPNYWNDESNRNRFIEKLKLKYNLKTPQDWKRVSSHQIKRLGGDWLFYNNMKFLKSTKISFEIKDSENENITKIQRFSLRELIQSDFKRSSQRWLFLQVQKLFPGEEIVEDYFHSEISRESGFSVQFDIFLIERNIAIEYHGQQHYEDIPSAFGSLEMHKIRDLEKKKLCEKYGIQLIIIPYWWDNNLESLNKTLIATISAT